METIAFLVQGSAPEPYRVTFQRQDEQLLAYCTCPAGRNGQYCKHRIEILGGTLTGILGDNQAQVAVVCGWLAGSRLEAALSELVVAEEALEHAKAAVARCKSEVASAMRLRTPSSLE